MILEIRPVIHDEVGEGEGKVKEDWRKIGEELCKTHGEPGII